MQYIDVIKQMLMSSLNDGSFEVRFAAVKASINFLLLHEKEASIQRHFGELLTPILTVSLDWWNGR